MLPGQGTGTKGFLPERYYPKLCVSKSLEVFSPAPSEVFAVGGFVWATDRDLFPWTGSPLHHESLLFISAVDLSLWQLFLATCIVFREDSALFFLFLFLLLNLLLILFQTFFILVCFPAAVELSAVELPSPAVVLLKKGYSVLLSADSALSERVLCLRVSVVPSRNERLPQEPKHFASNRILNAVELQSRVQGWLCL